MNRTSIEWTTWSWNPITGCKHNCWYCFAKKLCQRFKKIFPNGFEPTFHSERLSEPYSLKKPSKIFVCSIADLFASWTKEGWTNTVLASMLECPINHTFQMLTKNPERIMDNWILKHLCGDGFTHSPNPNTQTTSRGIPNNWWFGTTVTGEDRPIPKLEPFLEPWHYHVKVNGDNVTDAVNIELIKKVPAKIRFVSFEPLLGNIEFDDFNGVSLKDIQWVIIGKLTGSNRVKLKWEWVENILKEADKYHIPVFEKNNLIPTGPIEYARLFKKEVGWKIPRDFKLRQEFPVFCPKCGGKAWRVRMIEEICHDKKPRYSCENFPDTCDVEYFNEDGPF